ncbi:MAG: hypothetical protein KF754_04715 [Planctomycetes bacterium]|nr:hypothetical protein [Planctomycetota bacterium]
MHTLQTILDFLVQAVPPGGLPDVFVPEEPPAPRSTKIGTIVFMVLIGIAINVLFGLWAKAKGEDHGVNPWVGFAAGFLFNYVGVRLVPLLAPGRVFHEPVRRPLPPVPQQQGFPAPPPGAALPPTVQAVVAPVTAPDGSLVCPGCGVRVKPGKKLCMSCGATFTAA